MVEEVVEAVEEAVEVCNVVNGDTHTKHHANVKFNFLPVHLALLP